MLKSVLSYGGLAGLIVGIPLFVMAVSWAGGPPPSWGAIAGYATMLVALSLVFVAVKRRRDVDQGGVIRFWPALGLGLAISAVASLVYVVAWEAALAVTGLDFAKDYVAHLIEAEKAKGVGGEALAKFAAEMQGFVDAYANPLYRMPLTFIEIFPVGVLVSLVTAALLRDPRFLPARPPVSGRAPA